VQLKQSSRYRRKRRHKGRRPIGALLVAGLVALTSAYWALSPRLHRVHPPREITVSDPDTTQGVLVDLLALTRPVYRFSVIPGGVYAPDELLRALRSDEVAARHYRDFILTNVRMVSSPAPRRVYVSYRMGERVYWTRHAIRLASGERLLTDGVRYARARCGNRISETPQEPTAEDEPPVPALDFPVPSGLQPSPPLPLPQPTPVLPEGARTSARDQIPALIRDSPSEPVVVTPEPGSASQVGFAIPVALALWLRRRRGALSPLTRQSPRAGPK
jgi:hypothetical protein